jgi:hypothetical protein
LKVKPQIDSTVAVECNIRRGANFDVTPFFGDIDYGLRVARGIEPMPIPTPVPDVDGGKRRTAYKQRAAAKVPSPIA